MSASPLQTAAEAALSATRHRTAVFDHDGRRYVAKRLAERPRRLGQTLFMRWLVKKVTGQPLPLRTLALDEAARSMDFEANRLRQLAAAGVRVPEVLLQTDGYFVLAHCGEVVATLLETWTAEQWSLELPRLAHELGTFHAAGHWHGGAQIKNVVLANGRSTRIDFEENFGEFLPLAVAQSTDLLLFLNSVSLAGPLDETRSRVLLPDLLAAYRSANPGPEIDQVIARGLPWLRRLYRIARPFTRYSRKGIRRVAILIDVLTAHLSRN